MPKSKKSSRNSKRSNGFSNSAMQSTICRTRITGVPFRITQTTSGTGGITTVESSSSLSSAASIALDPYTIGGRFQLLANNFLQYRLVRGRITYVPDCTSTGLIETVSGFSTTPSYAARPFAIGVFKDSALSTINYNSILDAGGKWGSTAVGKVLTLPRSDWLWTSTTTASPTTIDLRTVAFGKLYFAYFNASTTATASFGHLIIQLDVEYKGVVNNAPVLGAALSPPDTYESKESVEAKPDDEQRKLQGSQAPAVTTAGLSNVPPLIRDAGKWW
jgi:hypothetical protein